MAKEGVLPRSPTSSVLPARVSSTRSSSARRSPRRVRSLAGTDRGVRPVRSRGLERDIHQHLKGHRGYQAVQAINGIGQVSAAVLVAEIGDVSRFPTPAHLCSWCRAHAPAIASPISRRRRGRISKQGSRLVRATLIEGISRYHGGHAPRPASITRSPNAAAATRPASRWRARSSRLSTTACATARSAASRRSTRRPREARTRPGCELDDRHDPRQPRCGRRTD